MAKPNIEHTLMTIAHIEGIPESDHTDLREKIYHALYYHRQGWANYAPHVVDTLIYGIQYIRGLETANYIERYHQRINRKVCSQPGCSCHYE